MKELLKECQGHCPLCNSDDLTYFGNEIEGDWLKYPYECQNCGNTGNECWFCDANDGWCHWFISGIG